MMICRRQTSLLFLLIACNSIFGLVNSHGYLQLHFTQYNNHDSRCADGTFCDTILFFNSRESACDPRFRLKADRYHPGGSSMYDYQQPNWYGDQDVINFGSTFAEMPNPVPFAMNYADNNGRIYITVVVTDKDTSVDDLIDVFSATLEASGTDVKSLTLVSLYMGHTLSLNYWYTCHTNYYGSLCNTFCLAQDSATGGHYTCDASGQKVCRTGWIGAATDCKTPHPCSAGVCLNGATCVPDGESYTCRCAADYAGTNCDQYRDPCVYRNLCANGAQCLLDSSKQPQCRCPPQFTGTLCDIDVDECAVEKPCKNGMHCINTYGGFSCNCTDAQFVGGLCEIDRCNGTVCQNNGTCLSNSTEETPRCHCITGFIGEACEIPNPCHSSPCQNGATCRNADANATTVSAEFTCACPPDFYGSRCEAARPDFCAGGPCRNGGNCTSGNSSFTCACPSGFEGQACELRSTSATPTRSTVPDIRADPLVGKNPGDASAPESGATGFSVAGLVAGCVIGFLVLAGVGVFLAVYLLRRRSHLAESSADDASSGAFSNAVYNNASEGGETVRSNGTPSVRLEDDSGEIYEAISGDPPGEPVGEQVNQAYEANA